MANIQSSRELVSYMLERVRDLGDIGRLLSEQIESAIAAGVEEHVSFAEKDKGKEKREFINRRQPTDIEIMGIVEKVISAYLVDLPEATRAFEQQLQEKYHMRGARVVTRSELNPLDDSRENDTVPLSSLYDGANTAELRRTLNRFSDTLKRYMMGESNA